MAIKKLKKLLIIIQKMQQEEWQENMSVNLNINALRKTQIKKHLPKNQKNLFLYNQINVELFAKK